MLERGAFFEEALALGAEVAVGQQFLLVMSLDGLAVVSSMKGEFCDFGRVLVAETAKSDEINLSGIPSNFDSKIHAGIRGPFPLVLSIFGEHLSPFLTPPVKNPNIFIKLRGQVFLH